MFLPGFDHILEKCPLHGPNIVKHDPSFLRGFDFMGLHNPLIRFGGVALGVPLDSHDERVGNLCNHGQKTTPD